MVNELLGRYLIEAKLGEGACAVVYKAHDIRLNRTVAVKVLKESYYGDTILGRLLREARIASALNHRNICALYDVGEEQGTNYIVLEFIEGQSLRAILKSGPLPVVSVLQYGIQIAEALAYTHSVGVQHRDLSSANLIITPNGQVKNVDFGLAKFIDEEKVREVTVRETEWLAGTLPYMAPELLHGEEATPQSSVWSLGVVLFEMLTGRLPFSGRTSFELSMEIMTGQPCQLPKEIPAGLRAIVQRCLASDKGSRYMLADEVLRDLKAEYTSFTIEAALSSAGPSSNQPHRARRLNRMLLKLLSCLLTV